MIGNRKKNKKQTRYKNKTNKKGKNVNNEIWEYVEYDWKQKV